jgi:hypothetical protein
VLPIDKPGPFSGIIPARSSGGRVLGPGRSEDLLKVVADPGPLLLRVEMSGDSLLPDPFEVGIESFGDTGSC